MGGLLFQRRLAADLMKCSGKRVHFDTEALEEIREAITKESVRGLVRDGVITKKPVKGISRGRARAKAVQKRKGRQRGPGSLKGKRTARLPKKAAWASRVRVQRAFIQELRDRGYIPRAAYRMLYLKVKGGFFRSRRHIKLYLEEQKLATKPATDKKPAAKHAKVPAKRKSETTKHS